MHAPHILTRSKLLSPSALVSYCSVSALQESIIAMANPVFGFWFCFVFFQSFSFHETNFFCSALRGAYSSSQNGVMCNARMRK